MKRSLSVLVIAKVMESWPARLAGLLVYMRVFEIGKGGVQGRETLGVNFLFSESGAVRVFGRHSSVGN